MKFEWQDDYIALSVSEPIVPKVREYIKNQEEHHRRKSLNTDFHGNNCSSGNIKQNNK